MLLQVYSWSQKSEDRMETVGCFKMAWAVWVYFELVRIMVVEQTSVDESSLVCKVVFLLGYCGACCLIFSVTKVIL